MQGIIKEAKIGREPCYLAYTVQTMLEIKKYLKAEDGEEKDLIDALGDVSAEGFKPFCGIAGCMARGGELLRRSLGYEKGIVYTEERIRAQLLPSELADLKIACMDAALAGMRREHEPEETDLGLAELEKKTA